MAANIYKIANSGKSLFLLVFFSWCIGALGFSLFENANIIDSLYWGMTTMSTVGYGDLSPASEAGKMFAIAFQAWSIFVVVPNAVAHVIDKVRRDEHKFTHDEQEWHEDALRKIAIKMDVSLPEPPSDTNF